MPFNDLRSVSRHWRGLLAIGLAGIVALPAAAPASHAQGAGGPAEAAVEAEQQAQGRKSPRRSRSARRAASAVATRTPSWSSPTGAGALKSDLGTILGLGTRSGKWGVLVVSLTRGDTLYSLNADEMLQPASNMKLFTAAIALDQFKPSHQFSTDVLRTGKIAGDGTLEGDLILRGDGDPSLSTRFVPGGPSAPMDSLARMVAQSGITRVRGRLLADAFAFDAQTIPDGWQSRYLHASYAARVSALSLNENLAWLVVDPAKPGQAPAVSMDPVTTLPILNKATTRAGNGARIVVLPKSDGGFEIRGWIGSRAGQRRYQVVVEDPAEFAAGAFRRALAAHGVQVDGETVEAAAPADAVRVASLPSAPLRDLLAIMNRESINHYAELIFRNAGRAASDRGIGTVETGNELLQRFMVQKVGAAPGSVYAADGSGLSVLDKATPRALVQMLDYAHRAEWGETFHASLPVAGESELLRNRMKRTPAHGNLHAKTGTTNTVISLAGYVTAESGELLAFAFIYNGTDRWNARTTIDAMGPTLASFVRR